MVPHRGTNWAAPWLTSQIGRDAVLSRSYGRGCLGYLTPVHKPIFPDNIERTTKKQVRSWSIIQDPIHLLPICLPFPQPSSSCREQWMWDDRRVGEREVLIPLRGTRRWSVPRPGRRFGCGVTPVGGQAILITTPSSLANKTFQSGEPIAVTGNQVRFEKPSPGQNEKKG